MVFIYLKYDLLKVLNLEDSKIFHDEMIADKWKHIVTLDSAIYLQMLLNLKDDDDILSEIKDLKKIHF